jgi:O-antigen ligase
MNDSSMQKRFAAWTAGLNVFVHQPIIGVGGGAYRSAIGITRASDTTFLTILIELGLIGFLLFVSYLSFVFRSIVYHISVQDLFWPTILAVWLPLSLLNNWEDAPMTWIIFTLVIKQAYLKLGQSPSVLVSNSRLNST